jgi:adenine deaminase
MMNFPGVVGGDERELAKLALADHVDGHAPGVLGKALQAYAAAGIQSDHEAFTAEEGRERLRAGMWLLIREASAARNLRALLPLVQEFGPYRMAFCTDDREPEHIASDGHVNSMVRDAVAYGIDPVDALVMASHHPAAYHGLDHLGAIAPGRQADVLVLPDLERFVPDVVLKRGAPVGEIPHAEVPDWVKQTVRVGALGPEVFRIPWDGAGKARVIGLIPGQIVTASLVEEPLVRSGEAIADPARDLAKIAVVERHLGTGRIGRGFVKGFGLERGALGTTLSHDAHNLVVVGMSDAAMAYAVRRLANIGGGIVVVDGAEVLAELPLPVAGILSDAPLDEVVERSHAVVAAAERLGCSIDAPFQLMAFLALSVIPSLKLTDRGLVDVDRFELVPLEVA